jgi:hypothetical protein
VDNWKNITNSQNRSRKKVLEEHSVFQTLYGLEASFGLYSARDSGQRHGHKTVVSAKATTIKKKWKEKK